jgi:hypothetical protein
MSYSFFSQSEPSFPRPSSGVCLCDHPLRIAGVNVLLTPARIVVSTPWAIRTGQVLLKTLQTLV